MEAVSVIGLVSALAGVSDVVGRSVLSLNNLRKRLKEADLTVTLLIGQLDTVKSALHQLQLWLEKSSREDSNHFQLSLDLESSLNSCRLLVGSIDSQISKLKWDQNDELKFESRARVVLEDARTKEYLNYLSHLIGSLNLLLIAFKCRNTTDQKKLLEHERSREVFSQLREDSSSLIVMYDSASFSSIKTTTTTTTSKFSMKFTFDAELLKHKAYQTTIKALMRRTTNKAAPTKLAPPRDYAELVAELQAKHKTATPRRFDKSLKQERSRLGSQIKVLILGLPGSGTTTFMRNIGSLDLVDTRSHSYAAPTKYRVPNVDFIIRSLRAAIDGMTRLNEEIDDVLDHSAQLVHDITCEMLEQRLPPETSRAVIALSKSSAVRKGLEVSVAHILAAVYFLDYTERILADEYVPTEKDIATLPKKRSIHIEIISKQKVINTPSLAHAL